MICQQAAGCWRERCSATKGPNSTLRSFLFHHCLSKEVREKGPADACLLTIFLRFLFIILLGTSRCPSNLPPLSRAPLEYKSDWKPASRPRTPPSPSLCPNVGLPKRAKRRERDAGATSQAQLCLHNSCWSRDGASWTLFTPTPPSPLLQVVIKCWLTALFLRVSGCGGVLSAAAPRTTRFRLMVSAASAAIHLSPGERVSHHHAQQRCAALECHLPADSVTRRVLGSVWRRTKLGGSWGGDFIGAFFSGLIVASCFVWK